MARRLTSRGRATAAAVRANARTITLLGCIASNGVGAGQITPAAGWIALGVQGLAVLWLEMKGLERGAR